MSLVEREDAVGMLPHSLPLGVVFHDFGVERQAAVDDVGMRAEVVVPGWDIRPPSTSGPPTSSPSAATRF
jgi:hypothetical protein